MDNGVIYARFSSQSQNEQSPEAQVRICKEFAEGKDINIVNIYSDNVRTGTSDARPAFQRMIADAKSGAFQYIVVYMFDRFARNRRDSIMYKEMLKEEGIKVLSALEPIAGKLFCGHCGTEMVADGGTSKTGAQHHYYICKKRRGGKCDKKCENKDNLELYVTSCVKEFLSNPENAETAVNDVLEYYDKRTDEQNLKSITAKIAKIRQEVSELTDAFVKAKSVLLQNSIETKMAEYEVLLNDLETQKAQLELERGYKLTKKDLLVFIEELLKGDVNDKD